MCVEEVRQRLLINAVGYRSVDPAAEFVDRTGPAGRLVGAGGAAFTYDVENLAQPYSRQVAARVFLLRWSEAVRRAPACWSPAQL